MFQKATILAPTTLMEGKRHTVLELRARPEKLFTDGTLSKQATLAPNQNRGARLTPVFKLERYHVFLLLLWGRLVESGHFFDVCVSRRVVCVSIVTIHDCLWLSMWMWMWSLGRFGSSQQLDCVVFSSRPLPPASFYPFSASCLALYPWCWLGISKRSAASRTNGSVGFKSPWVVHANTCSLPPTFNSIFVYMFPSILCRFTGLVRHHGAQILAQWCGHAKLLQKQKSRMVYIINPRTRMQAPHIGLEKKIDRTCKKQK